MKKAVADKYGLVGGEREQLEAHQGNRCAICRRPPKRLRLSVDHCHRCDHIDRRKSVRGLLCSLCNRGLFHERPELLRAAADYFELHTCTPKPPKRVKKTS